jgi:hypothetical protein
MKNIFLVLSLVFTIDCARAGKKDEAETLRRLKALQSTIDSQGETISSLTDQVTAQTAIIQQLANVETPDIVIDNDVGGQMVCTWEEN